MKPSRLLVAKKMREKVIVVVLFFSVGVLAAPREFLWEEEDDETESPENFFDKPKPIPTTSTTTTTTTTTDKHFILKPEPKPEPTTTTTEKPFKPHYPHPPPPPFHHKPPHGPPLPPPPPPPQYFQNPFIFPPRPFGPPLPPIGLLASPAFSLERPNPDAVEEDDITLKRLSKDEGVRKVDPKVTSLSVGGTLNDDASPYEITRRVRREATADNDRKNWVKERRKKKKKKQKPITPKPAETLSEENSSSNSITTPFQGTIKEESIEGIQTSTQNTSQSTQTHLVAYYMVYVVEVQQSSANNNSTVISEQTTSNVNQVTASPEASFIAEAAGAIPTEETFTQFQGTATSTGKPGGISIDQTGSSTNNGQGEEEGDGSDEDEDIFPPVFDLSNDKQGET